MHVNMKRAALPVAVIAATALPLMLAGPAQASTTSNGCTVTPLLPEFRNTYDAQNVPYVYYRYQVSCIASLGGLSVDVITDMKEQDLLDRAGDIDADGINHPDEDPIATVATTRSFGPAGGNATVDVRRELPHTDTDSSEEVWQQVRFRVRSGPVVGPYTPYELTQAVRIWW